MDESNNEGIPVFENELAQFVESCLSVIVTLSDIDGKTYNDELDDINTVKRNTYRTIYAIQKKMVKKLKDM